MVSLFFSFQTFDLHIDTSDVLLNFILAVRYVGRAIHIVWFDHTVEPVLFCLVLKQMVKYEFVCSCTVCMMGLIHIFTMDHGK